MLGGRKSRPADLLELHLAGEFIGGLKDLDNGIFFGLFDDEAQLQLAAIPRGPDPMGRFIRPSRRTEPPCDFGLSCGWSTAPSYRSHRPCRAHTARRDLRTAILAGDRTARSSPTCEAALGCPSVRAVSCEVRTSESVQTSVGTRVWTIGESEEADEQVSIDSTSRCSTRRSAILSTPEYVRGSRETRYERVAAATAGGCHSRGLRGKEEGSRRGGHSRGLRGQEEGSRRGTARRRRTGRGPHSIEDVVQERRGAVVQYGADSCTNCVTENCCGGGKKLLRRSGTMCCERLNHSATSRVVKRAAQRGARNLC